ncbi:hypothetical protein ACFOY2_17940 [Nonomuraea purpurea]|uniref:Uncharacterized protein n=1 Tax=Nonomuraea purpurea TaxID=1849276 RepID=A0ABV8GAE7_9ACTN
MRRHRFGLVAAALAAVYLVAVVVLAVVAQVTGEVSLIWTVVVDRQGFSRDDVRPWGLLIVVLVLVAAAQAWALLQILRGPERRAPARHGGEVRLLRVALYVMAGLSLLVLVLAFQLASWLGPVFAWWFVPVFAVIQLAMAWLFFRVLRGTTPRWLRLLILVTGALAGVHDLVVNVGFELDEAGFALELAQELIWPAWAVSLLAAQARDPRWSRTTVRIGVVGVVMSLLRPSELFTFGFANEVPWTLLFYHLFDALSVFWMVWAARSAHDLGSLLPPAPRPVRAPARRWPLPAAAIVLPLVPAAVNLSQGTPFWLGPKIVLWEAVREISSFELLVVWFVLDLLVGLGVPALLILIAVTRRSQAVLRFTALTLFLLAAVGVVSASIEASSDFHGELPFYPHSLFVKDGALVSAGISPLWFGLALTASALVLLFGYADRPARRVRHRVLVAGLASSVALCLLPAADQAPGPVTTAEECEPPAPWEVEEPEEPHELTPEKRFICFLRSPGTGLPQFSAAAPDPVVLAFGRRMCDLYTRNDVRELARWKTTRQALTNPIAGICPSAAAVIKAERAEQNREVAELQAEAQRVCDATPRHRPRIKPAKAIRIKKPQWTDYGVLQTYEGEEDEPNLDPRNGLVSSEPGTLVVITDPDFDLCTTVETYARRPPVETKGWDKVVEVGYHSPTGKIVLSDSLSGTELPDLSLNGRAGHYRIRVHHAWFPWKGEKQAAQRLLIMAYPAPGDKEIVYRK